MKYKVSFTKTVDTTLWLHEVIIEREGWKRSHFMKAENRETMVEEAMRLLSLSDSDVSVYKIDLVQPEG